MGLRNSKNKIQPTSIKKPGVTHQGDRTEGEGVQDVESNSRQRESQMGKALPAELKEKTNKKNI